MGIFDKLKKSRNKGVASNTDPIQAKINAEIEEYARNHEELKKERDERYQKVCEKVAQMEAARTETVIEVLDSFDKEEKEKERREKSVIKRCAENLKRELQLAEICGIENLDIYRNQLSMLESLQIQEQVHGNLNSIWKKTQDMVDKLHEEINKSQQEEEQQVEAQDETIYGQIKGNAQKETQNNNSNEVKSNEISRTGSQENQGKRDEDYYDSMHEERRKAMRQWSESQANQGTQNEGALENKDKEKTKLEGEDKDIDEMLRQKWDRMLGL